MRTRWPWTGAAVALVAVGLSSCGASHASVDVVARNADIEVINPFVPLPPSPDVAAVYLELRNISGRSETLLSVSAPVATSATAMSEGDSMPGMRMSAGEMMALGPVTIAARATFSFTPGHNHLMLQGLRRHLAVGQTVLVDLRFDHAPTLVVDVPVVSLSRILGSSA